MEPRAGGGAQRIEWAGLIGRKGGAVQGESGHAHALANMGGAESREGRDIPWGRALTALWAEPLVALAVGVGQAWVGSCAGAPCCVSGSCFLTGLKTEKAKVKPCAGFVGGAS